MSSEDTRISIVVGHDELVKHKLGAETYTPLKYPQVISIMPQSMQSKEVGACTMIGLSHASQFVCELPMKPGLHILEDGSHQLHVAMRLSCYHMTL